ncbi:MAG: ribosome maturation factor RimP [Candidatus Eiseniibacteriota bacterium]
MEVREEVRLLAQPLAEEAGFELVDVEFSVQGRHRSVRVLLDRPGGITVGDCGTFSRRLADCLDMNQTIPWGYHLEVSSPGVDRPLRSLEAVARFAGRRTTVSLSEARDGKRNFDGELLPLDGTRVGLRTPEGEEHWFEWAEVRSARLVVDPWERVRNKAAMSHGGESHEQ